MCFSWWLVGLLCKCVVLVCLCLMVCVLVFVLLGVSELGLYVCVVN